MGDAGFVWSDGKEPKGEEKYWRKWISNKPWTTFCICGNHENYDLIESDFEVENFYGAPAKKITDSLFYAITGEIYNFNNYKCLAINGADSHDIYTSDGKLYRKPHVSWWPQERITDSDIAKALSNANKYNNKIDFLFSHTGGTEVNKFLGFEPTPSDIRLDQVINTIEYKKAFCGHYHTDAVVNEKTRILYDDIIEIGGI